MLVPGAEQCGRCRTRPRSVAVHRLPPGSAIPDVSTAYLVASYPMLVPRYRTPRSAIPDVSTKVPDPGQYRARHRARVGRQTCHTRCDCQDCTLGQYRTSRSTRVARYSRPVPASTLGQYRTSRRQRVVPGGRHCMTQP
eukprot:1479684-Rhodomonas_salina.3